MNFKPDVARGEVALIEDHEWRAHFFESRRDHAQRCFRGDAADENHAQTPSLRTRARRSSRGAPPMERSGIGVAPAKVQSPFSAAKSSRPSSSVPTSLA